jgi:hypothetical protein
MPFQQIIDRSQTLLQADIRIAGFSIGGSWGTAGFDEYSDLDITIAVYPEHIEELLAERTLFLAELGNLLTAHQHAADHRILVALYDCPPILLHIDAKWVALADYYDRIKDPRVIWERNGELTHILNTTAADPILLDMQFIEDRIWAWLHYILAKLGRGELMEAIAYLYEIRVHTLAPIIQAKHDKLPYRLRRVESLPKADFDLLLDTHCEYDTKDCLRALRSLLDSYVMLRETMSPPDLRRNAAAEAAMRRYMGYIEEKCGG